MTKHYKSFLLKTLALTSIIVGGFNIWWLFINAQVDDKNIQSQNTNNSYANLEKSEIAKTWVAITTNLWLRFKQRWEIPATIYKDVFSLDELQLQNYDGNNIIIAKNMAITQEYKDILRSDFKQTLEDSLDKPAMLEAIIEQLEYRYETATDQVNKLNEQKWVLESAMTQANTKKENIKTKIDSDFQANNPDASIQNISDYLEAQNNYYYARTYVIFINQFLREYQILNDYNKRLLDVLINNKNAIINSSYVVIPDTGEELLKEFDLLYEESDYKSQ